MLILVCVSYALLSLRLSGHVVSLWLVLVLCLACWMGPLGVIPLFVWFGLRFACFAAILLFGL